MDQQKRYDDLRWRAQLSIRYHSYRQGFYGFCHKASMVIVVLAGSASIAAFAGALGKGMSEEWKLLPPVVVTLFAMLDVLLGFADKAAKHWLLLSRFTNLEQGLVKARSEMNPEVLDDLETQMLLVETDEPKVLHVLNAICHNELVGVWGYDQKYIVPLTKLQRTLAQFFDWKVQKVIGPAVGRG